MQEIPFPIGLKNDLCFVFFENGMKNENSL